MKNNQDDNVINNIPRDVLTFFCTGCQPCFLLLIKNKTKKRNLSLKTVLGLSVVKMCTSHAPFISGLSQHSTLFSAVIMVPLFIPEGILVQRLTKSPHPHFSLSTLTALICIWRRKIIIRLPRVLS